MLFILMLSLNILQYPNYPFQKYFIQLQCYGHVQRMEEGRLPKEVMKWRPPGRRKRGRPKHTWAEGIRGLMGEKGLMEEDWNDRGNWRKKIL